MRRLTAVFMNKILTFETGQHCIQTFDWPNRVECDLRERKSCSYIRNTGVSLEKLCWKISENSWKFIIILHRSIMMEIYSRPNFFEEIQKCSIPTPIFWWNLRKCFKILLALCLIAWKLYVASENKNKKTVVEIKPKRSGFLGIKIWIFFDVLIFLISFPKTVIW